MKVVLDANILCQDYWRRSTNFQVFRDGLPSVPATLCLPEVVIDEVANRLREDLADAIRSDEESIRTLARLANQPFEPASKKVDVEARAALFRGQLLDWVKAADGEVLSYPDISHQ